MSPSQLCPATAWLGPVPSKGVHVLARLHSQGGEAGGRPALCARGKSPSEVEAAPLPQVLACGPVSDWDSQSCLLTVKGGDSGDTSPWAVGKRWPTPCAHLLPLM